MSKSTRASRLAKYLEKELGWAVFETESTCPQCGRYDRLGMQYCGLCGARNKQITNKKEVLEELSAALDYADGK